MSHPPVGPEGFTPSVPSQPAPAPLPQASTPPNAPPPGTPYQVPPQSAVPPPTDQVSYAPGSAAVPPVSAPPPTDPTMIGLPYGSPPTQQGRGRGAVVALAVVAALLFVFGGVMTGLFVAKSSELDRTRKDLTAQVAERDATIEANHAEIEKLKQDLEAANDKIAAVEQDLAGTEEARKELQRQKSVIAECLALLGEAGEAAAAGNRSAYERTVEKLEPVCDEAGRYL